MRALPLLVLLLLTACGPDDKPGDTGAPGPVDDDGDGYDADQDCDDTDPAVFPEAEERCDGIDNDCDGTVDEDDAVDATTWYADADGDGFCDLGDTVTACAEPAGFLADCSDEADCDDADEAISPEAEERCDGVDNDCDGTIDEDDAIDATTWYHDGDGDDYGDATDSVTACEPPYEFVADSTDCDDDDDAIFPGAEEHCDGVDNDCDGVTDEPDAVDAPTWYRDDDADDFGDPDQSTVSCTASIGWVAGADDGVAFDCDDSDDASYPGADEYCDGVDTDCDGTLDEDDALDALTWYADDDGDGFGDPGTTSVACAAPAGFLADDTDCDDSDGTTFPGADEYCDGIDTDCDGTLDEDDALDVTPWYLDADGDGYGDAADSVAACAAPTGYVADDTDCDDGDASLTTDCSLGFRDGSYSGSISLSGTQCSSGTITICMPLSCSGTLEVEVEETGATPIVGTGTCTFTSLGGSTTRDLDLEGEITSDPDAEGTLVVSSFFSDTWVGEFTDDDTLEGSLSGFVSTSSTSTYNYSGTFTVAR